MKKTLAILSFAVLMSAQADQFIEKSGSSTIFSFGQGYLSVVIDGPAAQKIYSEMIDIRMQSTGRRVGTDIVCEKNDKNHKEKQCTLLISDSREGDLGQGAGSGKLLGRGLARAYHYSSNADFAMIEITGGKGSPAQILWSNLARSTRSGLGQQKAGNRYTCDQFKRGSGVTYRCEFSLEKKSEGQIGLGGVG